MTTTHNSQQQQQKQAQVPQVTQMNVNNNTNNNSNTNIQEAYEFQYYVNEQINKRKQEQISKLKEKQKQLSNKKIIVKFIRYILYSILFGYYFQLYCIPHTIVLPWGYPLHYNTSIPYYSFNNNIISNDTTDNLLQFQHGRTQRIYERVRTQEQQQEQSHERLLNGPETIVIDPIDGTIYALTENAKLVKVSNIQRPIQGIDQLLYDADSNNYNVTLVGDVTIVKDLGMGRPLGGVLTYNTIIHNNTNIQGNNKKKKERTKNVNESNSIGPTLYVCDAVLGLTRIQNIYNPLSKIEIVASHVIDTTYITKYIYSTNKRNSHVTEKVIKTQEETAILYANDISIGPRTGNIYFTDSTNIAPDRIIKHQQQQQQQVDTTSTTGTNEEGTCSDNTIQGTSSTTTSTRATTYYNYIWDTMYAFKLDILRNYGKDGTEGSGRLLMYNPNTDSIQVLVKNIRYSNGISFIDNTENFLVFVETSGLRLYLYNIDTTKLSVLVDSQHFPGYIDGIDCIIPKQQQQQQKQNHRWNGINTNTNTNSTSSSITTCYVAIPAPVVSSEYIFKNYFIGYLVRAICMITMIIPRSILPKSKPFGGIMEVQINNTNGHYITHRLLVDPSGTDISSITGISYSSYNNKLYLGSLSNNYIGVYVS